MPIPKAVQEGMDAAEAKEQAIIAAADVNTVVEDDTAPAAAGISPEPVEVQTPAPQGEDDSSWRKRFEQSEQKYRVLQGKYDAEVPVAAGRVRQAEEALASSEAQHQETQANLDEARRTQSHGEMDEAMERAAESLTGEDVFDVVKRQKSMLDRFGEMLERLTSDTAVLHNERSRSTQSAWTTFWAGLKSAVPNYLDINEAPQFQAWAAKIDEDGIRFNVHKTHSQLLQDCLEGLKTDPNIDVAERIHRASEIYKAFVRQDTNGSLDLKITPSESATTEDPEVVRTDGQKQWSVGEVQQAYSDLRRRRYKPKDAESLLLELEAAEREGRITMTR